MGATIWLALAATFPDFNREDWVVEHQTDKSTIVSYTPENSCEICIRHISADEYKVILEHDYG